MRYNDAQVKAAMKPMPTTAIQSGPRSTPSASISLNPYAAATCAKVAMTMTSVASIAHAVSHPALALKALRTQVKLVPQSGWTRLS